MTSHLGLGPLNLGMEQPEKMIYFLEKNEAVTRSKLMPDLFEFSILPPHFVSKSPQSFHWSSPHLKLFWETAEACCHTQLSPLSPHAISSVRFDAADLFNCEVCLPWFLQKFSDGLCPSSFLAFKHLLVWSSVFYVFISITIKLLFLKVVLSCDPESEDSEILVTANIICSTSVPGTDFYMINPHNNPMPKQT